MEKYDIISVVGEGSYGLVMRCRHRDSGQYVAIKKFLETEDDPTVRKMALREIRMLKKLRHENLVNMIEVFRRKKRFFLVFEYLEHTVLEELEARSGGLGYITSRKYIYQVLRALDFIHSHDVIHRDIKPENVLVSRLGVIKLCDFGFARPYSENETFTDYVATRWYRSPELLVGDRYGKEVDIWAVGCLYCEMMTGEPLFPGESDIDQLFQIVRILGKLSSRHQILIMRNAMFRGMKQEQNTSLTQMFPDWNRDSIDFLIQCLKMDGNARPDTAKLLKHDLFVRDNFLDNFLSELRAKLAQEMQVNPLLKRIPSYGSNGRWNKDEKRSTDSNKNKKKSSGNDKKDIKSNEKQNKMNLSVLSTQLLQPVVAKSMQQQLSSEINVNTTQNKVHSNGDTVSDKVKVNDELLNANLSSNKQSNNGDVNQPANDMTNKQISINNLTFKDGNKYSRILSAKLNKSNGVNAEKVQTLQPPSSPIPFQSLQPESLLMSTEHTSTLLQNKRLSPVTHNITTTTTNNNNTNNANNNATASNTLLLNGQNLPQQYFNYRRHSNVLGVADHVTFPKTNQPSKSIVNQTTNQIPFNVRAGGIITKRDRDRERSQNLIDATLKPLNSTTLNSILAHDTSTQNIQQVKDSSPRILPPPQWLTGNLKFTTQGKIGNAINATNGNSKRRITDWKSVGIAKNNTVMTHKHNEINNSNSNDLVLPNCPGAISPKKSNSNSLKKKLSTLSSIYQEPNHNLTSTPRNFSASSDHINET